MERSVLKVMSTVYRLQSTAKKPKAVVGSKETLLSAAAEGRKSVDNSKGFTMIEAIIVLGISIILVAIGIIALRGPQARNSLETTTTTLVSDLKQQQLLSMMGDSGSQSLAQAHGIRVTANSYTNFTGSAFAGSTNQFVINLPQGVTFSGVTFPLDIIFAKRSGATTAVNNLIIQNTANDQRVMIINRLGAITVN